MPHVSCSNSRTRESDCISFPDGNVQRNGFEVKHWRHLEQKYQGKLVGDALHGEGAYEWYTGRDRLLFEGQFYSNFKEGYGLVSLPDGSVFEGLFYKNRPFGPGIYTYVNGRQDVGFWYGDRIVRLSRSLDFIIPRLACTPIGKLKLLRYQAGLPYAQEEEEEDEKGDVTSALLLKHRLNPNQRDRVYSNVVQDPRSLFFNKPHFDREYSVRYKTESEISPCSETGRGNTRFCVCVPPNDEPASPEPEKNGLLRHLTDRGTLSDYPVSFPGGKNANRDSESSDKMRDVEEDGADCEEEQLLLAFNRNALCVRMAKQIFRFRPFEDRLTFKIADVLAANRTKFRKTGEKERLALYFLKMCSIGPAYVINDLLCSNNVSPNVTDSRGNNSIMFAAAVDQHEVIDLLLDFGADVNTFNDENLTPLNLCLLRRIAVTFGLGNWEISFLPPDSSLPNDDVASRTKTCQPMMTTSSLDRKFGDGMSAIDTDSVANSEFGCCRIVDSSVLANDSLDSSLITLLEHNKNETDDDEFSGKRYSRNERNSRGGRGFLPASCKREEYEKSVADPAYDDKYWFQFTDAIRKAEDYYSVNSSSCSEKHSKLTNQSSAKKNLNESNPVENIQLKVGKIDKTVELLVRRGADANLGDAPKPSLHLAVHSKQLHLVRLLLMHGAAPDSHTIIQEGFLTPLHVIVLMKPWKEQVAMCKLLLNYGANPEEETAADFSPNGETDFELDPTHGRTPLQLLCTRQDAEHSDPEGFLSGLARLLVTVSRKRHFFRGHSYLTLAMISGNYSLMKALLASKRTDPNEVLGENLGTALHVLVSSQLQKRTFYEDSIRMCDLLLEHGANPNVKFRIPRSLAGTSVDFGYREIEKERNRDHGGDAKSELQKYLDKFLGVVQHLERKTSSGKEGNLTPKRRITPGDDERKAAESSGDNVERAKEENVEGMHLKIAKSVVEPEDGKPAGKGELPENGGTNKTKLSKGRKMKKEPKTRTDGNKSKKAPVGERIAKKSGRDDDRRTDRGKPTPSKAQKKEMTQLPETLRQSLLHIFGICGEKFCLNDFLLPYVVLRNGDLYYRFNRSNSPVQPTEQYSLI